MDSISVHSGVVTIVQVTLG